ncbi:MULTISPECIES: NF038130 family PEP-CTERM protein [Planktothrix]|jgi:hypothetical protein|uniref:Ice-binding protein C-terminal domain-containing protein n=2 Tax=Planktothrix TaxID=54304 RepID=A0A4P5ZE46_PLAAG|nr:MULTISPECIES: NF038130 family PEP-CTERM protein [Planktothrix]CAD5949675.1 hypothetical protein NO108_02841 [Planktothrix rubescens]CAC5344422.1 conserved exported hypothetical protein [Planktothrix rubescens NIVA-CYA 18]CAD5916820.1 hypothetical protein PCC7821_00399 [Planktothrix rubescens NIVA-CYA 18]CAH2570964.1 hypothetical protein PRNO82_00353 [Planktothrix rubescens]GDZ94308.1 hypothetical protein PA905_22630 [Planktothrix agardhii CCAP 1459/11A]
MATSLKKLLIGTSVAVGMSAVGITPALAGSLTNATIGGTASTDYLIYGKEGNKTVVIPNSVANLQSVLDGNAVSPTGNVELAASSEKDGFVFTKNTSLTGDIGGKSLTLSSLTASDWATTVSGGLTLAQKWFGDALTANGYGALLTANTTLSNNAYSLAWNAFNIGGGLQRFSDPNISYVNQDDSTGDIKIGLAGHLDATPLLFKGLNDAQKTNLNRFRAPSKAGTPIQASEVVKYTYNGTTNYLYNFFATASKLTAADDGKSHNGNYEVGFDGVAPAPVPEPSTILGLMAIGGLFGAAKRNANKKA